MALAAKRLAGLVGVLTTLNILQSGSSGVGDTCEVGGSFRGSDDFKASPRERTVKGESLTFTSRSPTDRARADIKLNDRKPFTPASLDLSLTNTEKLIIRFILDDKQTKNLVYKKPSERFSLPSNNVPNDVARLVIITEAASLDSKTAFKIEKLQGCVYESTTSQTGASQTAPPSTPETTETEAPTIPSTSVNSSPPPSPSAPRTTAAPPPSAVTTIAAPPASETVATTAAPPATEAVTTIAAPPATEAVTTIAAPPATEAVTTIAAPPASEAVATTAAPPATEAVTTIAAPPATEAVTTIAAPPATDAVTTIAAPPATATAATAPATTTETAAPVSACGLSRGLDRLNGVTNGQPLSRRRRVVGGTSTGQCDVIPWQVRLTLAGGEICGGSIIDASHILTAGHCIPDSGTINITAGDYNTGSTEGSEQTRQVPVTDVTVHPQYYTNVYGAEVNDIAVVKLSEPLDLTGPCVEPVCLDKDFMVSGQNCTISGWGRTAASQGRPSTLQYANVLTHNGGNCQEAFNVPYSVFISSPETQLCAGRVEGGVDACAGDDGGPLVCRDDSRNAYVQAGIASYGYGCGDKNFPGIYTKISAFYDWILEHTDLPTTTTGAAPATTAAVTAAPPPPPGAVPTIAGPPPSGDTTISEPVASVSTTDRTAPISDCGVSLKLDGRVGAESCDVIPWQVRLTFPGGEICGGSIIDASHILTAGHCIPDSGTFNVTAADHDISSADSSEQIRQVSVSDVTVHPQYYTNVYGSEVNDIAVVKLSEPLDMTGPCVEPVCLDKDFMVSGQNCTMSGWGTFLGPNGLTETLNYGDVLTYRGESCAGTFSVLYSVYISTPQNQLCAALDDTGASDCTVDQGGPLVCRDDSKNAYVLAGLASYIGPCDTSGFPGVYTEISAFYDWIQEQLT